MTYMTEEAINYWIERGYSDARNLESQAIAELAQEGYDVLEQEGAIVGRIVAKEREILERHGIDTARPDEEVSAEALAIIDAVRNKRGRTQTWG
jgi:hypothetical protein